jgi:hypothetical protein
MHTKPHHHHPVHGKCFERFEVIIEAAHSHHYSSPGVFKSLACAFGRLAVTRRQSEAACGRVMARLARTCPMVHHLATSVADSCSTALEGYLLASFIPGDELFCHLSEHGLTLVYKVFKMASGGLDVS